MKHWDPSSTAADIDLVERCLEGEESAILDFKRIHLPYLRHVLFGYRASDDEADEILSQLWIDCLSAVPPKSPLILRYNGRSALKSWLAAVAVNRWLSLKRRQVIHAKAIDQLSADAAQGDPASEPLLNLEVLEIITEALRKSFSDCLDEEVVLLHLVHVHHLTQREVASLWNAHESQISRKLHGVEAKVAHSTISAIKDRDPHLDITWRDFVHLCESTNLLLR